MNTFTLTLTSLAVLSLSACATSSPNSETFLLGGIAADNIKTAPVSAETTALDGDISALNAVSPNVSFAESQIRTSLTNPTCAQFNINTLAFATKPETPTFGTGLLKTIIMGTVAGVASGGVSSLGIGSPFIASALAGTANQVAFSGAKPLADKVVPKNSFTGTEKELLIKSAAEKIDCPYPSWVSTLSSTEAALLSAKFKAERKAAIKAKQG